jgi:SAM-dependent methyltransferase
LKEDGVMELFEKKDLNDYQKEKFEESERGSVAKYFSRYEHILKQMPRDRKVKILDMGGGSGNFAFALHQYFTENGYDVDVYLLDITRYATWEEYASSVHFLGGSVFEAEKHFGQNVFDIVFLNLLCHHLIQSSWYKTVKGISALLVSTQKLLKCGGGGVSLCV